MLHSFSLFRICYTSIYVESGWIGRYFGDGSNHKWTFSQPQFEKLILWQKQHATLSCWHFVGIKSPEQYTRSSESVVLASADNGRWSPIEIIWCNVTSTSTLLHFQPSYLNKNATNIHACMWYGCIKVRKISANGCVHFNDKIHK